MASSEHSEICRRAMQLLRETSAYSQVEVLHKLEQVGQSMKTTLFNNILNGKGAGARSLSNAALGMQAIVRKELGMEWINGGFVKTANDGFQPEIVPTTKRGASHILHENGRLNVADKVAFFRDARQEVIEFGVTLNRFTHNLCSGGSGELSEPIASLLRKGVNFKCYLINPDCNEARLYFGDRKATHPDETNFERKICENLAKLDAVQADFSQQGYPGNFEVFTYRHIPYNYFMVVDGGTEHCKMMVSHYLYGLPRNQAPVLEFSRNYNPMLCRRYWESFQALTKNATRRLPQP